jgi:hypothetical protein
MQKKAGAGAAFTGGLLRRVQCTAAPGPGPLREHLGDALDDRKALVVARLIRPGSELASLAVAGGLQTAAASPARLGLSQATGSRQ